MRLFQHDFGDIRTDEELEDVLKRFSAFDPGYICQAGIVHRRKTKEWMEDLWQEFEPYADPNFLAEFPKRFNQRSWELYLGATFLDRGYNLAQHDAAGPDFDVHDTPGKRI